MKDKALKISLAIATVICMYVFISIRMPNTRMYNFILKDKLIEEYEDHTPYGELYYLSGSIADFKVPLPKATEKFRYSKKAATINQAEILIFGDSQFDFSRQTTFPERLCDSTRKKVFYYRFNQPYDGNIIAYLKDHYDQADTSRKLVIYESAERYVVQRAEAGFPSISLKANKSGLRYRLKNIKEKTFNYRTEVLYRAAVQRSYLTYKIFSFFTTIKFKGFKYIPSRIGAYRTEAINNATWLFATESVTHYNKTFDNNEITAYADTLKSLQDRLDRKYNMDFIFLIIPESYTIYMDQNKRQYRNNFIVRLREKLAEAGVNYVDLYQDFVSSEKILYYQTDTHWNKNGVDIAVENVLTYLNKKRIEITKSNIIP